MIRELDRIVLTAPAPEEGLESGDVGTVVATATPPTQTENSVHVATAYR